MPVVATPLVDVGRLLRSFDWASGASGDLLLEGCDACIRGGAVQPVFLQIQWKVGESRQRGLLRDVETQRKHAIQKACNACMLRKNLI